MKQAKTRNRLRKAAAAMAIPALLLVLTSNNALCQSPGQTVEEKYPGLLSGVLKNARLASMDEQILFQTGNATINRAGLAQQLNAIDGAARLQLEKNLLFLLDQEATRAILLNEAAVVSNDRAANGSIQSACRTTAYALKRTHTRLPV